MSGEARKANALPDPPAGNPSHVRPHLLTVWPMEEGFFGIDVRWHGHECALRAVTVRRLLAEARYEARLGNSLDGREWELRIGPVPADDVASVIQTLIW
jgi:hypothetical protein